MTWLLLLRYRLTHTVLVMFANTGAEHPRTLVFVDRCDRFLGFKTVWLEAVVHPAHGTATTHRVVTFETAARACEPYEAMIKKFGIPNKNYPHCTRELKLRPMESYLRSIGWEAGEYFTAIGIRADEADRRASDAEKRGLIYPLIGWAIRKGWILRWWKTRPFDLEVQEHRGNCEFCWKKSQRKLLTLVNESPAVFDFPRRMEHEHGFSGAGEGRRVFFRGGRSTETLFELAKQPFEPFVDNHTPPFDPELDTGEACGETCEVGADE